MIRLKYFNSTVFLAFIFSLSLCLGGCAAKGKSPDKSGCNADIEWQITPEAEVTQFDCAMGTSGKGPALIFKVGIKNISDKPLRYRLNIFLLDQDKAAGYLVPRKGKPPVLEPGKAQSVEVPFLKTTEMTNKVLVVVKTVGY